MKHISLAIIFFTTILFSSCGNSEQSKQDVSKKDSDSIVVVVDTLPKKIKGNYNRLYNDIARYLAGMNSENGCLLDSFYLKSKEWKSYSETAEKRWYVYDSTRIQVLKSWSKSELAEINKQNFTLFYPFSGPDILHADCFYPNADTTIMVGLEPVGTVPFTEKNHGDTLSKYFGSVNNSLYAILNFSFFRTQAMKKDLRSAEINGTAPLMMIFLERTRNRVLDVKYVHVDSLGKVVENTQGTNYKIPGVQITYCNADSTGESQLFYFSCDLSNEGLSKTNPALLKFVQKQNNIHTYLKSASYLMHMDFFSIIRDEILVQSKTVLQDDSGVPHRFFSPLWDYTLYGKYTGVISLFKGDDQSDLDSIFKGSTTKKALDFGIGYKWHKGESNLVYYQKKSS